MIKGMLIHYRIGEQDWYLDRDRKRYMVLEAGRDPLYGEWHPFLSLELQEDNFRLERPGKVPLNVGL